MELVLNVAWFIIAAASYALFFRVLSGSAGREHGPSRCQCIIASSCALAILFPVISLTDDLHERQATVEESSSSRIIMKKCGVNHQLTPVPTPHQLLYVVSSLGTDVGWLVFGDTETQRTVQLSRGLWLTTLGRAPPAFFVTPIS